MPNRSSAPHLLQATWLAAGLLLGAGPAWAQDTGTLPQAGKGSVNIAIDLEGTRLTASLDDSQSVRAFVSQLPLTLTLKDHAATEKIADLPKKLPTQGSPPGHTPRIGDLAYYAPWGNLALYYRDFPYSAGLVRLGTIDGDVKVLARPGPLRATFRLLE